MISKISLAVGALLFALFCSLQFNDAVQYSNSDAWIWIFLYGTMAALNARIVFKPISANVLFSWAGFCWGCLLFRLQDANGNLNLHWLHPANYMSDDGAMIQQSNESGGLLVLALWATLSVALNARRLFILQQKNA